MFNRKKCLKCGKKSSEGYEFCPHCGKSFEMKAEDWGMLGKDDFIEPNPFSNSIFAGFGEGILGKMIGSAMKMLEKEMQKEMRPENTPKTSVQLFINGKRVNPEKIQPSRIKTPQKKEIKYLPSLSLEKLKKAQKLPRKEPKTSIRRFSDKVVYEIEMPGVKTIEDVSIIKLESSIEIKALAKEGYYFKTIPIALQIINYEFSNDKLILELESK